MMTKKGHLWEIEPHKAAELDKEIYMFLAKVLPGSELYSTYHVTNVTIE